MVRLSNRFRMRETFQHIVLIILLSLAFSNFTACTKSTAETSNVNSATTDSNSGSAGKSSKSSGYPPLASGLADSEFELLDGTKFKVSDKKGKVLLLNIWGTWCGPCREEMPHLIEMQNEFGPQGFEVVGLNIGDGSGGPESIEDIKAFVDRMKLNYTIARSPTAATVQFYLITKQQVVPQTLLVDRDGHLRGVFIGGGQRVFDSLKDNVQKTINES